MGIANGKERQGLGVLMERERERERERSNELSYETITLNLRRLGKMACPLTWL